MRNHYDLGPRTKDFQPPATEAETEIVGFQRKRYPLWIKVFIASLLLGSGTAVYAVTAFGPSSAHPEGDRIPTHEKRAGFDGFTNEEKEKADTPSPLGGLSRVGPRFPQVGQVFRSAKIQASARFESPSGLLKAKDNKPGNRQGKEQPISYSPWCPKEGGKPGADTICTNGFHQ